MTVSDVLSVIGGITGPFGLAISLLVFFRDRARISVSVSWDMITIPREPTYPGTFGSVTVVNLGRRPAYVSHISIRQEGSHLVRLLPTTVPGKILEEGSGPYSAIIDEKPLKDGAVPWWLLRVSVSTASGRLYFSPWLERPPDWAASQKAPRWAGVWNKRKNQLNRLLAMFN